MTPWLPISGAPVGKEMFVAKAIGVEYPHAGRMYTSDPYCVWQEKPGVFIRWPHVFPPTHYYRLPIAAINCAEES